MTMGSPWKHRENTNTWAWKVHETSRAQPNTQHTSPCEAHTWPRQVHERRKEFFFYLCNKQMGWTTAPKEFSFKGQTKTWAAQQRTRMWSSCKISITCHSISYHRKHRNKNGKAVTLAELATAHHTTINRNPVGLWKKKQHKSKTTPRHNSKTCEAGNSWLKSPRNVF